jgi:large subunit ribosomal protein L4
MHARAATAAGALNPLKHFPRFLQGHTLWRAVGGVDRGSNAMEQLRVSLNAVKHGGFRGPGTLLLTSRELRVMTAAQRPTCLRALSTEVAAAEELLVAPKVTPPGLVRNFKEELWRRQKVATTFFTHPVAELEDIQPAAGSIELASAVFRQAERLDILNRVVLWQRAKKRVIARPAKTRAMVQGGGKKPWRQKGSGRARHGSIRSPIWKGGGKAHGPVARSFAFSIPKKVRRLALRVALSARMREGKCVIIRSEALKEPRTQYLDTIFKKWGWENVLVICGGEVEDKFKRAINNIPNADVLPAIGANVYRFPKPQTLNCHAQPGREVG